MNSNLKWFVIAVAMLLLSRIVPHPSNFTPIIALAGTSVLFAKDRFIGASIVLSAMLLSDIILGLHSGMIVIYGTLLSIIAFSKKDTPWANTLMGAVLFFVVSNFSVWLGGFYGYTWEGLVACYVAAIPFFANTLAGTVFYTVIILSIYSFAGGTTRGTRRNYS